MTDEEIIEAILGVFQVNSGDRINHSITLHHFLHDGTNARFGNEGVQVKGHVTVATISVGKRKQSAFGMTQKEALSKLLEKLKVFDLSLEQHLALVEIRSNAAVHGSNKGSPEHGNPERNFEIAVRNGRSLEVSCGLKSFFFSKSSVLQMIALGDGETSEVDGVEIRRNGSFVQLATNEGWDLHLSDSDLHGIMIKFADSGNP